jgi:apolipoprotein D and lipocalin family protein
MHARMLAAALAALSLVACHRALADKPLQPVSHVDLSRYMGSWYVIASIPTHFGRDGYNPVETYRREPDGEIFTSFRFRDGGFDGPIKTIHSVASIRPGSGNAAWDVHLFHVLREQYIVAWLAPDYSRVIVARDARDYTWLMARTPRIPPAAYSDMLARLKAMGYDLSKLRVSPQHWPEAGSR